MCIGRHSGTEQENIADGNTREISPLTYHSLELVLYDSTGILRSKIGSIHKETCNDEDGQRNSSLDYPEIVDHLAAHIRLGN